MNDIYDAKAQIQRIRPKLSDASAAAARLRSMGEGAERQARRALDDLRDVKPTLVRLVAALTDVQRTMTSAASYGSPEASRYIEAVRKIDTPAMSATHRFDSGIYNLTRAVAEFQEATRLMTEAQLAAERA